MYLVAACLSQGPVQHNVLLVNRGINYAAEFLSNLSCGDGPEQLVLSAHTGLEVQLLSLELLCEQFQLLRLLRFCAPSPV